MSRRLHFVQGEWNGKKRVFRDGIVVVGYIPNSLSTTDKEEKMQEIVDSVAGATVDCFSLDRRWVAIRLPGQDPDVVGVAEDLATRPDVRLTQPDFLVRAAGATEPAAEEIDLWWVADVRAEDAWKIETGKENVLIGIIDSGVPLLEDASAYVVKHDDLNRNQFTLGPDYTEGGEDAEVYMPIDEHGHGTAVAGIIAAMREPEAGVKGMNTVSPVCVCRVLKKSSGWDPGTADGSDTALHRALEYLMVQRDERAGVDKLVINISAVMPYADTDDDVPLVSEYVREVLAGDERVIVCASAGNDGDDTPLYPAAFADASRAPDTVVAVSAYVEGGERREDSSYGAHITVSAPGDNIWTTFPESEMVISDEYLKYGPFAQTSSAAPIVAGVASLVWSKAPGLSAAQVIECMRKSARVPDITDHAAEQFGAGYIDAYGAIPDVVAELAGIAFIAVPSGTLETQAIRLSVKSCIELHFRVNVEMDPGSSPSARIYADEATFVPSEPFDEYKLFDRVTLSFRGASPGNKASGKAHVTCDEFGDAWRTEVEFTASTTSGDSYVVLVADSSGSMAQTTGAGTMTRMDALKLSASVMIDELPLDSAMAVVAFSDDAVAAAGPVKIVEATEAANRGTLKKAIESLAPGGLTSIGDGLEMAQAALDASAEYGNEAIVVLTDGRETTEKWIADVLPAIKSDVYSIGLGTPDVVHADTLAAMSTPYALITGETGEDGWYKVAKYFLQILADVNSEDVVLDPSGRLRPEKSVRVPFPVTSSDERCDVVLTWPWPGIFGLHVETPSGVAIRGGSVNDASSIYRLAFPVRVPGGAREHAGRWHAVINVNEQRFDEYAGGLSEARGDRIRTHGALYNLVVTTRSLLRLSCSLTQQGYVPGSDLYLRARVTDHGAAVADVHVTAIVKEPDGTEFKLSLKRATAGFESRFTANLVGLYEILIRAEGTTSNGHPFIREQVRTAFTSNTLGVWPRFRAPSRPIP